MPSVSLMSPVPPSLPWRHWFARQQRNRHNLPQSFNLGAGNAPAVSLQAPGCLRITCTAGTVWLTCEHDVRDHVLEAGDEHLAQAGDDLVLLGMPSASVSVTPC